MTKHTPREMKVSDRSLWGDTPFCSQVRMARIVEHSPMNGIDADHLANEMAKRWNCHEELLAFVESITDAGGPYKYLDGSEIVAHAYRVASKARGGAA